MSTSQSPGGEPTEEELRAAYEAQLLRSASSTSSSTTSSC